MRQTHYTSEKFDYFVRLLIGRWEDAVEMQKEWSSLDVEERLFQTEDWPVNNDIHQHLADYVAENELAEDQKVQWAKLNKLVAEHRKDLEEMGYRVLVPVLGKAREAA
ncbi:MAG: hypothetical protein HY675_11005 [Chloroflexi bacterium]|nr:hypothetical protein [Chloroflexota bacterium]